MSRSNGLDGGLAPVSFRLYVPAAASLGQSARISCSDRQAQRTDLTSGAGLTYLASSGVGGLRGLRQHLASGARLGP